MEKEKKRSTNFSTFETNLLIKLVEDKKHVLDPQKLNAASLNMKHGAWREITANFNNHSQIKTYRDEKALKKKYSNLKCDSKNWPSLRNEALAKLGVSPENQYQFKPEKPDLATVIIKPEPIEEKDYLTYLKEMEHQINDELPAFPQESTETDASTEDTDSSSHRKRPLLLDKHSEEILKSIAEKRTKLSEKEAKLKIEILETEHQEHIKFLQLKHKMTMKRLELEQERCRLELDFLKTEESLKEKFKNSLIAQANENEDESD